MVKLVQLGCSVGKFGMFAAALQLGAWGAPGRAASQFLLAAVLCAPMGWTVLHFRTVLKTSHFLSCQNKSQFLSTRKPQQHFLVK